MARHFDWSENYRDVDARPLDLLRRIAKRLNQRRRFFACICRLLPVPTDRNPPAVLEVACGMGIELSLLSLLGYQTCGMDSNDDALHYANRVRAFLSSRVEIEKGDAFRMSYGDETFDLVYSQGFLEHFSDREVVRLVAEQIRVLRTGGYLLVDVPNKYSAYALYKLCFRLTGGWVFGFERQFSPRQIRAFVATASPRMAFVERYGWSFLGYPVRTPLDFLFMAPLLALREAMRLVNRGQDSVVVILRKS